MSEFIIKEGELVCYLGNAADITIPNGVRKIGRGAFIDNKNLQRVILPDSLRWIGQCAFAHCENLKRITIPASVTFIDRCAFSDSGLEEIVIEGKPEIRLWAFDGTPWKENQIKRNGDFIRDGVLLSVDPELTQNTIPSEVKVIGRDAFKNSKIKEIDIPEGVTKLDICAFAYSKLERISLPGTLKIIEAYAFSNCKNLAELTIPESVTDIDNGAFEELPNCVLTILNKRSEKELFRISDHAFAFGKNAPHIKEVHAFDRSVAMRCAMNAGVKVNSLPRTSKKL